MPMKYLTKAQITDVIEGRGNAPRVPILYSIWINAAPFGGDLEKYRTWMESKPCDVCYVGLQMPGLFRGPEDAPEYRWAFGDKQEKPGIGLDSQIVLDSWEEAEEFYASFPDPEYPNLLPKIPEGEDRYVLVNWWYTFFERHWSLRGMENTMYDFFIHRYTNGCWVSTIILKRRNTSIRTNMDATATIVRKPLLDVINCIVLNNYYEEKERMHNYEKDLGNFSGCGCCYGCSSLFEQ